MATAEARVILAVWAYLGKRLPYRIQAGNKKLDEQIVNCCIHVLPGVFCDIVEFFWGLGQS